MSSTSLAIRGGSVLTDDASAPILADVLVVDGRIVAIGGSMEVPSGGEVLDATGCIVGPGLLDLTPIYANQGTRRPRPSRPVHERPPLAGTRR